MRNLLKGASDWLYVIFSLEGMIALVIVVSLAVAIADTFYDGDPNAYPGVTMNAPDNGAWPGQ